MNLILCPAALSKFCCSFQPYKKVTQPQERQRVQHQCTTPGSIQKVCARGTWGHGLGVHLAVQGEWWDSQSFSNLNDSMIVWMAKPSCNQAAPRSCRSAAASDFPHSAQKPEHCTTVSRETPLEAFEGNNLSPLRVELTTFLCFHQPTHKPKSHISKKCRQWSWDQMLFQAAPEGSLDPSSPRGNNTAWVKIFLKNKSCWACTVALSIAMQLKQLPLLQFRHRERYRNTYFIYKDIYSSRSDSQGKLGELIQVRATKMIKELELSKELPFSWGEAEKAGKEASKEILSMCITPDGKEEEEGDRLFPMEPSDKRQGEHTELLVFGITFYDFINCREVMEPPGLHPWKYSKPD